MIPANFNKEEDIILFYTPEAEVHSHFIAQCVLAKNLSIQGYKTAFVFCPGIYCRCPAMDCHSLSHLASEDMKRQICRGCIHKFSAIISKYGLSWIDLGAVVDQGMLKTANNLVEQAQNKIVELEYDNIPFGKIAYGDYAIECKRWETDSISEEGVIACKAYAHSSIVTYLALNKICSQLPIKIINRFNDYANNMGAYFVAKKNNLRVFTISYASHLGGVDRRKILILPKLWSAVQQDQIKVWEEWKNLPINTETIYEICSDSILRLKSSSAFVYSPARQADLLALRKRLNLNDAKKCLVAFTSSPDERHFSKQLLALADQDYPEIEQAFTDHSEWLRTLINFVENSNNLELVIRIHPREGKNPRYPKISKNYELLYQEFGNREFQNCRIVWPEESISSYDLIEFADVGLTSWSSIGLEMARLGVPVVTAFRNMSFPSDQFHQWGGATPEEYLATIIRVMSSKNSLTNIIQSYRCYNLFQLGYSVSVEDQITSQNFDEAPEINSLTKNIADIESIIIKQVDSIALRKQQHLEVVNQESCRHEELAIVDQLKRILFFLCVGEDLAHNFYVNVTKDAIGVSANNFNVWNSKNGWVEFNSQSYSGKAYSPLSYRLVNIILDNLETAEVKDNNNALMLFN
jgi:hypothetical protein